MDDAIRWLCQLPPCDIGSCGLNCTDDCSQSASCNGNCDPGEDHCTCSSDCLEGSSLPENCQPRSDWFLWLAFNAPHRNRAVPTSTGCGIVTDERTTHNLMLEIVDCELKRLADALEAMESDQNTTVDETTFFVVGDNGTDFDISHWPDGHEKGSVYEGGVRVPLIVGGKNVQSGAGGARFSDALVNTVDIFSTALELMGVNVQTDSALAGVTLDSKSFLPILGNASNDNPNPPIRQYAYVESFIPSCSGTWRRAVRDSQYNLIQTCPAGTGGRCFGDADNCTEELYAVSDVLECCNLATDSAFDGIRQGLRNAIKDILPGTADDVECTTRPGDDCMGCCADVDCSGATPSCALNAYQCTSAPSFDGIAVTWVGPPTFVGPFAGTDYEVRNWLLSGTLQPHVLLKTSLEDQSGLAVQEYRVSRASAQGQPLPLGAVTTNWPTDTAQNITVHVGFADPTTALEVGAVAEVDIDAESGGTWSAARLVLSGDLQEEAEVSPGAQSCSAGICSVTGDPCTVASDCRPVGGRISGSIAGTVQSIRAQAIGQGTTGAASLRSEGLASSALIALAEYGSALSILQSTGTGATSATVAIAHTAGMVGPVVITDQFNGKLCADNLIPAIPGNINVAFGPSGQVCDGDCQNCVAPCQSIPASAIAEPTPIKKNRFIPSRSRRTTTCTPSRWYWTRCTIR